MRVFITSSCLELFVSRFKIPVKFTIAFIFSILLTGQVHAASEKELLRQKLDQISLDANVKNLLSAHSLYLSVDTFSRILYDDSLVIHILTRAPVEMADGLIRLAFLEADMGNFKNTRILLEQAISISKSNHYKTGLAYNSFCNGLQAYENGDFATAENDFKKCIDDLDHQRQVMDLYSPLSAIRIFYNRTYQYEKKLEFYKEKVSYYEKNGPHENLGSAFHGIANYYLLIGNYEKTIEYYSRAAENWKSWGNEPCYFLMQSVLAEKYMEWGNFSYAKKLLEVPDNFDLSKIAVISWSFHERVRMQIAAAEGDYATALQICKDLRRMRSLLGEVFLLINNVEIAKIYLKMGEPDSARYYLDQTAVMLKGKSYSVWTGNGDIEYDYGMAMYYRQKNQPEMALASMEAALEKVRAEKYSKLLLKYFSVTADLLASMNRYDKAYGYVVEERNLKDSLDALGQATRVSLYETDQKEKQQEHELLVSSQKNERQRIISLAISAGFLMVLIFSIVLFNRFRFSRKQAQAIAREKEMVEHQRQRAENSIQELKAAQTQLVQSEKMASLGELTAGIAHEIQNPLNFVNNFSELSDGLLDELEEMIAKGDTAETKDIIKTLRLNLEKINHHGKRADNIVKSMLLHSRQNTGEKQSTDINELTDEYLKLAYHGLRAKDKNFQASIKTDYDKSIGRLNVVQQDLGRVILNLTNNACYAVSQKKRSENYEPLVSVSTKQINGHVEISIRDNGNGIPKNIVDKIFQPFFTTKPTGQGTGLGLSLSYDVVQAHGGNIEVHTEEGKGSEFKISLPVS